MHLSQIITLMDSHSSSDYTSTNSEYQVKAWYTRMFQTGKCEVNTPVGKIDLVTDNEIIEFKVAFSWKEGVGQLLSYKNYFPEHKCRLVLFGKPGATRLIEIVSTCASLDIALDYLTITPQSYSLSLSSFEKSSGRSFSDFSVKEEALLFKLKNWLSKKSDIERISVLNIIDVVFDGSVSGFNKTTLSRAIGKCLRFLKWTKKRTEKGNIWLPPKP